MDREQFEFLFETALNRKPSPKDVDNALRAGLDPLRALWMLLSSKEGLDRQIDNAFNLHLYFIHNARIKAVRTLLPPARQIVDLGGAFSPLYEMGYEHPFESLTLVDLPPEERAEEYKAARIENLPDPRIHFHFGSMVDLSAFPERSFDLAWSGQSIEHITPEDGEKMAAEVYRTLVPGGLFALDTPNRLLTSIHTGNPLGMINPDHKIEYTPPELTQLLVRTGFTVQKVVGIVEMKQSFSTGSFDYREFVLGSPVSNDPYCSYITFVIAQKPLSA